MFVDQKELNSKIPGKIPSCEMNFVFTVAP